MTNSEFEILETDFVSTKPMADEIDSVWTREQDRAFEDALVAHFEEDSKDCWDKIATDVPGKTAEEIKHHYELLVDDLDRIESGIVPIPCYSASSDDSGSHGGDDGTSKKAGNSRHHNSERKASKADQERRKGVAWTEDEHRLFLLGLEKYGKGDWRSISRNFVVTRTPTQVASHAQKYFIRLNSMNRDRRRTSIHDITSVNNGETSAPITGQTNVSPAGNSSCQSLPATSDGGTTVGLPIVGTPVNRPPPSHMAYGIRAPGQVVPGAPMNVVMLHTRCETPPIGELASSIPSKRRITLKGRLQLFYHHGIMLSCGVL